MPQPLPASIDQTQTLLAAADYVADRSLATALYLSLAMQRPLFLEGEAGTGKTEIAKVVAQSLGRELIRLQCYEGLDIAQAAYEWNYPRQMIEIRLAEAAGEKSKDKMAHDIFEARFLIKRPLALALEGKKGAAPVLLIDELDRADEEFEAFLLEILSDFQVTVPELGTIRARQRPIVVITSNRTREVHDALRRRCLFQWIDYPSLDKERRIVEAKVPQAPRRLTREVVAFVQALRTEELYKRPGVAETLDWVEALVGLDRELLTAETVETTMGALLKYQDDVELVRGEVTARLLESAQAS